MACGEVARPSWVDGREVSWAEGGSAGHANLEVAWASVRGKRPGNPTGKRKRGELGRGKGGGDGFWPKRMEKDFLFMTEDF